MKKSNKNASTKFIKITSTIAISVAVNVISEFIFQILCK